MKTLIEDFNYNLPKKLIANTPTTKRDESNLMVYDKSINNIEHVKFSDIVKYFEKGDMILLNNTKVIPGRLYVKKETGGQVELLFHKKIDNTLIQCIYKSSRPLIIGTKLFHVSSEYFIVMKVNQNYVTLRINSDFLSLFNKYGEIPLPKYIKRIANDNDVERYQTTYASIEGSVAAPTAGLHFTKKILNELKRKGVIIEYVTLHVTYNTFKPIKTKNYLDHDIGSEYCEIKSKLINKISKVKNNNKKLYAVGTTSTRAIEAYYTNLCKDDYYGDVDLYITPGYEFKVIDGLITNFHLPKSTLLLLVASLIGRENLMKLYTTAIKQKYRFYSYGDSMLIKL